MSRKLVRSALIASMVFQSSARKRIRLPSMTITPEYICVWEDQVSKLCVWYEDCTYLKVSVAAYQSYSEAFSRSGLVSIVEPNTEVSDASGMRNQTHLLLDCIM